VRSCGRGCGGVSAAPTRVAGSGGGNRLWVELAGVGGQRGLDVVAPLVDEDLDLAGLDAVERGAHNVGGVDLL
jgi:hypothetical protein